MTYAGYNPNDFVNGKGISVSLWVTGCPHHCKGCFNPETWDYNSGKTIPDDIIDQLKTAITDNGITRNFSVLGGEPLCPENRVFVDSAVSAIRESFPTIKIYIWSGYTYSELLKMNDKNINSILEQSSFLIEGKFEIDKKDLTLELRGSSNQNIIDLKGE